MDPLLKPCAVGASPLNPSPLCNRDWDLCFQGLLYGTFYCNDLHHKGSLAALGRVPAFSPLPDHHRPRLAMGLILCPLVPHVIAHMIDDNVFNAGGNTCKWTHTCS